MKTGSVQHLERVRIFPRMTLCVTLSAAISLLVGYAYLRHQLRSSVFDIANLVGTTAWSLLHRQGMTACTTVMGTPGNPICFHAGRMPLAPYFIATAYLCIGNHVLVIGLLKLVFFLVPVWVAMWIVLCAPAVPKVRRIQLALLLIPFLSLPFLADVANCADEEGYLYGFLALSFSMLLFPERWIILGKARIGWLVVFITSVDLVFLAKSSMRLLLVVFLAMALTQITNKWQRILLLLSLSAAPVGWASYVHHITGRFTFGTSIDGVNLHKGNNEWFLDRYPSPSGVNLDPFDYQLSAGHSFPDEWTFNDYHVHAALHFIRTHPVYTAHAFLRKFEIYFLYLRHYGSGRYSPPIEAASAAGMMILRLLLWTAIAISVYAAFSGQSIGRTAGIFCLAVVLSCAAPYLAGFANTRHATVLLYPSAVLCCRYLSGNMKPWLREGMEPGK